MTSISPFSLPVWRDQDTSFTAVASDPDNDHFDEAWTLTPGACPSDLATDQPAPTFSGLTFPVMASDTGAPFCVWAFATDRYGAVGVLNLQVNPMNHPPTAGITVASPAQGAPYPLYSHFVLSGQGSSDPEGDPLSYGPNAWTMTAPVASTATLVPCPTALDSTLQCFQADLPGSYVVKLTISDGTNDSAPATAALAVQMDQLPCIRTTMPSYLLSTPLVLDPTMTNDFIVDAISDDGDPFPPTNNSTAPPPFKTFTWTYGPKTDPTLYNASDSFDLRIFSGTFEVGDEAQVRLEISDRQTALVDAVLKSCGDAAPECAGDPSRPACFQRVTWDVEFNL